MVANCGPAEYNYDETVSTLRYASRAKSIKNVVKINEDPKDALLRKIQEEIEELKRQMDGNAPAGGGGADGDDEGGDEPGVIKTVVKKIVKVQVREFS